MDFRRSNPHFKLSSDPRQQAEQPVSEQAVVPGVVQPSPPQELPSEPTAQTEPAQQSETVSEQTINFVPPPPSAPVVEPPVIESMKPPEPEEVPVQAEPEVQPVVAPAQVTPVAVPSSVKAKKSVPLIVFIIVTFVLLAALAASVYIQQKSISELKTERNLQAEQLKQVNPISVGGGEENNE